MIGRYVLWIGLTQLFASPLAAQLPLRPGAGGDFIPGTQGSTNMQLLAHLPLGNVFTVADIEVEQELARPYVYVSRMLIPTGVDVISVKDPERAEVVFSWRIEDNELNNDRGGTDNKYFKHRGRYYDVQALQFRAGMPATNVGAVVFDVTGLPDPSSVREVGRIEAPDSPGGFHNIFMYKHSSGRPLLFTTNGNPGARVYDMERFIAGEANYGWVGRVPVPEDPSQPRRGNYHDFYVGYDPAARMDKFYGAGTGGFHVYDVTAPAEAKLVTSVTGAAGVRNGHTFTPTPDGRYAVAETEYQYAPLRMFDLKPGLDGDARAISRPIGAWTADWKNLAHNHEVRWPYVFVSAYEDGLMVFNMMDPTNPYTVGYYYTYDGPHKQGYGLRGRSEPGDNVYNGVFGVDVRNADGLIVVSDMSTGFWSFKMDGFDGWNGHQWGMPNISSVQDWDNGPDGAPAPVS